MKQTINFFKSLIMSGSGNSSMRFIALHSTLVITYVWAFVCIWRREFVDFPMGVIYFAGITIIGKVIQKFPEVGSYSNDYKKPKEKVEEEEETEDYKVLCERCKSEIEGES